MLTPAAKKVRLVIHDREPSYLNPRARCEIYSEPLALDEALVLGRQAMERLPEDMRGRAFIEGVTAPAVVELVCEQCKDRSRPESLKYLRNLLLDSR